MKLHFWIPKNKEEAIKHKSYSNISFSHYFKFILGVRKVPLSEESSQDVSSLTEAAVLRVIARAPHSKLRRAE